MCSIQKKKVKDKPDWMSGEILDLTKRKRTTWRSYCKTGKSDMALFRKYKDMQKTLTYKIWRAKRNKEHQLASNSKFNPKAFFSYIKRITKCQSTICPLDNEEEIISSNIGMANVLNSFFTSVFTKEDESSIPEAENLVGENVSLQYVDFSTKKIKEKLKNVRSFSAPGPDMLYSNVLKELAEELSFPLWALFNQCMHEGYVPEDWRRANVTPIYKKGPKTDPCNYRPVSLTSIVS